MTDNLDITIVIRAVDEASAALDVLTKSISDDFTSLSSEAAVAGTDLQSGFSSVAPALSGIQEALNGLKDSLVQTTTDTSNLDTALAGLESSTHSPSVLEAHLSALQTVEQNTALSNAAVNLSTAPESVSPTQAHDLLPLSANPNNDAALSQLVDISRQQLQAIVELLDAVRGGSSGATSSDGTSVPPPDTSSFLSQLLPDLERALTRGATIFGNF